MNCTAPRHRPLCGSCCPCGSCGPCSSGCKPCSGCHGQCGSCAGCCGSCGSYRVCSGSDACGPPPCSVLSYQLTAGPVGPVLPCMQFTSSQSCGGGCTGACGGSMRGSCCASFGGSCGGGFNVPGGGCCSGSCAPPFYFVADKCRNCYEWGCFGPLY